MKLAIGTPGSTGKRRRAPRLLIGAIVATIVGVVAIPAITQATDRFTDVPTLNQFHDAISFLHDVGVVTEDCDGSTGGKQFCPTLFTNRQRQAQWIWRAFGNDPSVNKSVLANPTGNMVGIGTTTPTQKLHIQVDAGEGEGMMIESGVAGHSPAIYLQHTGTGGRTYRIASWGNDVDPGSFRIRDDTPGSVGGDILTLFRVGAATSSTLALRGSCDFCTFRNGGLSVEDGTRLINFGMNEDSNSRFGGTYTSADQGGMLRVDTRTGQPLFQFLGRAAGATSGAVELVQIRSDGNVGIGRGAAHQQA